MIEIYCGDVNGKTTASVGLAVRAAGHDIPVIFAQFLKDDSSGEIAGGSGEVCLGFFWVCKKYVREAA